MTAAERGFDGERGVVESGEGEARGGLPDVIYLPDQSQPEPPQPTGQGGRKGRHFGRRHVPDPRSARLDVRCTPSFRVKVLADAMAAGLSLSAFVCARLGEGPSPRSHRSPPGPDMVMLAQIKATHGRHGGNLHQLVKRLNSYDFRGQPELLALRELAETTLTEHRKASATLMRALGGRSVTDDH
jgi:hypothetical protein